MFLRGTQFKRGIPEGEETAAWNPASRCDISTDISRVAKKMRHSPQKVLDHSPVI